MIPLCEIKQRKTGTFGVVGNVDVLTLVLFI